MKAQQILLTFTLIISSLSCTPNKQELRSSSSDTISSEVKPVKKLDDIKLTLLDERNEKAEIYLGTPDVKGRIMSGVSYFLIYYNKVDDGGKLKHLLLLIDGHVAIDDQSPVYRIEALQEGETAFEVGNIAQTLKISERGLKSNSLDFVSVSGTSEWQKVGEM